MQQLELFPEGEPLFTKLPTQVGCAICGSGALIASSTSGGYCANRMCEMSPPGYMLKVQCVTYLRKPGPEGWYWVPRK